MKLRSCLYLLFACVYVFGCGDDPEPTATSDPIIDADIAGDVSDPGDVTATPTDVMGPEPVDVGAADTQSGDPDATSATCGDGECGEGEDDTSCPEDCTPSSVCGDSVCSDAETPESCPEDCPAPSGACTNAADQAVMDAVDVTGLAQACGLNCLGQTQDCAINCVVDDTGLSEACAQCYSEIITCSVINCLNECVSDPASEVCTECQGEFCTEDFYACTGLEPSE